MYRLWRMQQQLVDEDSERQMAESALKRRGGGPSRRPVPMRPSPDADVKATPATAVRQSDQQDNRTRQTQEEEQTKKRTDDVFAAAVTSDGDSRAAASPMFAREAVSAFGSTAAGSAALQLSHGPHSLQEHQRRVPRLPVCSLRDTCERYLKSIEGLASAEEYERNVALTVALQIPGDVGVKLHNHLLAREASHGAPSWLEPWWDDMYLVTRDPVPINVNYFFGFEDDANADHMTQVGRAAALTHAAVCACVQIRNGTWSLDTERGKPLCMSQYRRVFCASRVPGELRDRIVSYASSPLLDDEKLSTTCEYVARAPNHIVVMARNRMFKVAVLDELGKPLPLEALLEAMAAVAEAVDAPGSRAGPPVGLLTTMERTAWYHARRALVAAHPANAQTLDDLQSAIVVVALDQVVVGDLDELARVLLHGTGTNRWFDRHNLIVTASGRAGINFEHSVGDGATTLRVADTMYRQSCKAGLPSALVAATRAKAAAARTLPQGTTEVTCGVDGTVDSLMRGAFDDFRTLIESNETTTLSYKHFGGDYIKKAGISPDAFVQLAFQLTHYRLFGRLEGTYESASTRGFLHGRTEVVRGVSRAALDFCEASTQPAFARRIHSKVPDQAQLLRWAAEAHVEYMQHAKAGLAVDRHFLALRMLAMQHDLPLPALLQDPIFKRACHWTLSTSHCGSSALSLFGFGPVVADGFGLGYMIKNDTISVTVTAKYTHRARASEVFASMLESSLLQMKAIVECDWEKRRNQKPTALAFSHPTTGTVDFEYEPGRGFVYRSTRVGVSRL